MSYHGLLSVLINYFLSSATSSFQHLSSLLYGDLASNSSSELLLFIIQNLSGFLNLHFKFRFYSNIFNDLQYEKRNPALWGTGQRQQRQVQVRCVTLQKQTDLLVITRK